MTLFHGPLPRPEGVGVCDQPRKRWTLADAPGMAPRFQAWLVLTGGGDNTDFICWAREQAAAHRARHGVARFGALPAGLEQRLDNLVSAQLAPTAPQQSLFGRAA